MWLSPAASTDSESLPEQAGLAALLRHWSHLLKHFSITHYQMSSEQLPALLSISSETRLISLIRELLSLFSHRRIQVLCLIVNWCSMCKFQFCWLESTERRLRSRAEQLQRQEKAFWGVNKVLYELSTHQSASMTLNIALVMTHYSVFLSLHAVMILIYSFSSLKLVICCLMGCVWAWEVCVLYAHVCE